MEPQGRAVGTSGALEIGAMTPQAIMTTPRWACKWLAGWLGLQVAGWLVGLELAGWLVGLASGCLAGWAWLAVQQRLWVLLSLRGGNGLPQACTACPACVIRRSLTRLHASASLLFAAGTPTLSRSSG